MSADPILDAGELAGLGSLAATDAWLDAVSRDAPPPNDELAEAMNSWLTGLSADYLPGPAATPSLSPARHADASVSLAGRSARGAVAVAVAAALFVGAGTAAAIPTGPLHRIIFGHRSARYVPAAPDYRPAELALARASDVIVPLLPGGVVTPAQRSEAIRLIADAAAAIALLPSDATRATLDAQRAALLTDVTRLRVLGASGGALGSATPGAPTRPVPATSGDTGQHPPAAAPTTAQPRPTSDPSAGIAAPSTAAALPDPSTTPTTDPTGDSSPQPTDPGGQDNLTTAASTAEGDGLTP